MNDHLVFLSIVSFAAFKNTNERNLFQTRGEEPSLVLTTPAVTASKHRKIEAGLFKLLNWQGTLKGAALGANHQQRPWCVG